LPRSADVLRALAHRTGIDPAVVDDVIWGCVGQVGDQSGAVLMTRMINHVRDCGLRYGLQTMCEAAAPPTRPCSDSGGAGIDDFRYSVILQEVPQIFDRLSLDTVIPNVRPSHRSRTASERAAPGPASLRCLAAGVIM
jgi:hypothetical protein